jgi:hypothetical protein
MRDTQVPSAGIKVAIVVIPPLRLLVLHYGAGGDANEALVKKEALRPHGSQGLGT